MKRSICAVFTIALLASFASAQVPVVAEGTVGTSSPLATTAAPVLEWTSGFASSPALALANGFSPAGGYVAIGTYVASAAPTPFNVQYVIEFDVTGQGGAPLGGADLTIYVARIAPLTNLGPYTGTFALFPMIGVNEDRDIDGNDHLAGGLVGPAVGTYAIAGATIATFTFNITAPMNFDILNGRSFSGYVLTYSGAFIGTSTTGNAQFPPELTLTAVPEPGTVALFGLGLLSFAAGWRIRRKKSA